MSKRADIFHCSSPIDQLYYLKLRCAVQNYMPVIILRSNHAILYNTFSPQTSISEIFAIIRQWVPQVQKNLETFVNEVSLLLYHDNIIYLQ
jgi:hypothetical protein